MFKSKKLQKMLLNLKGYNMWINTQAQAAKILNRIKRMVKSRLYFKKFFAVQMKVYDKKNLKGMLLKIH